MMQTISGGRGYRRRLIPAVCVALLVVLVAGSWVVRQRTRPAAAPPAPVPIAQHDHPVAATGPLSAPDLALRLESLLGEHSVLAADMMRARIRGEEDFIQTANAALGQNTDAMVDLVSSNFGATAADRFKSLWAAHVAALYTYASGLADRSDSVRAGARTTLTTFERDLANFFVDASQGRLNRDVAQAGVTQHVDHLLQEADAFASHDYATADQVYRLSFAHTYALGHDIAAALVPPSQATALDAPVWRLRSELGRLLAEHVVLMVDASRAAVTNSPDFPAAGDAVNGNTKDLAAAMASLFGQNGATGFQSLWADHIDDVMAYTAAVVSHDAKGKDAAVAKLKVFANMFAAFLDGATQHRLDAAGLTKTLGMHDEMLLRQADAYAAKQYQQAHDIAHSTYAQMFDVAGAFADAFGATVASRLPSGGPKTGLGGMAGAVGQH